MESIRRGSLAAGLVLVALVAVAACSGGGAAASATPPPGTDVSVTAQGSAFTDRTIHLPANRAATMFFRNLDGAPHNVAIYRDSSAAASLFVGERITDAATTYQVPALAPGDYFFRCDVHPNMTGTVVVGG